MELFSSNTPFFVFLIAFVSSLSVLFIVSETMAPVKGTRSGDSGWVGGWIEGRKEGNTGATLSYPGLVPSLWMVASVAFHHMQRHPYGQNLKNIVSYDPPPPTKQNKTKQTKQILPKAAISHFSS